MVGVHKVMPRSRAIAWSNSAISWSRSSIDEVRRGHADIDSAAVGSMCSQYIIFVGSMPSQHAKRT